MKQLPKQPETAKTQSPVAVDPEERLGVIRETAYLNGAASMAAPPWRTG